MIFIQYILSSFLMKSKKNQFLQRKDYFQNRSNIFVDRNLSNSKDKYRYSVATDTRFNHPQTHRQENQKRFSMNINSNAPTFKVEETNKSYHTMQNIKNTLSLLQSRINNAKQELNGRRILGKSIIYEESQQSKLNQSNSINESQHLGQKQEENKKYFHQKKPYFNQIIQIAELTKIKSYYKSELAKIFISNNQSLKKYFSNFWQQIKDLQNLQQNHQINHVRQLAEMGLNKKILVLGLDETIIHCEKDRTLLQNIDIILPSQGRQKKQIYVSIRPYAISFIKKMSKKCHLVIFSTRTKRQTDLILDEIDPLGQFIHNRLYQHNCNTHENIVIKDLRIFNRDLSSLILIDSAPSIYPTQLTNLIPIIPYSGGSDSELYSLQKYLEQIVKVKDIRLYNSNYFQLKKYTYFDDAFEALKNIYFSRH